MDQIDINLIEKFRNANPDAANLADDQILALFAGSGKQELEPSYEGLNTGIATIKNSSKNYIQNKLMDKIRNFKPPTLMMLASMLPKEDPVITQARNYYSGLYGLDNIGRISQGDPNDPNLMAGYNPIHGGLLNMLTRGKLGDPTNVGLDRAYQKRIDMRTSKKTLDRISKLSKERQDAFFEKTKLLQDMQAKDNAAIQAIKLANATTNQKQNIQDMKSGPIDAGMPEQPKMGGGGRDSAPMQTFSAPTKQGQSPRGSMSGQSIPDRGMGRY